MRTDDFDRWLDETMSAPPGRAPAGFTDRVMARVARAETPAIARTAQPEPAAMPWWIEMLGEPAAALALGVAALLAFQAPAWLKGAPAVMADAAAWLSLLIDAAGAQGHAALTPLQLDALALGLLPPMILLSAPLYRWTQRLVLAPRRASGAVSTAS